MNVVFIGHVDAGKSTTGGQILYLTVHPPSPPWGIYRLAILENAMTSTIFPNVVGHMTAKQKVADSNPGRLPAPCFHAIVGFVGIWGGIPRIPRFILGRSPRKVK